MLNHLRWARSWDRAFHDPRAPYFPKWRALVKKARKIGIILGHLGGPLSGHFFRYIFRNFKCIFSNSDVGIGHFNVRPKVPEIDLARRQSHLKWLNTIPIFCACSDIFLIFSTFQATACGGQKYKNCTGITIQHLKNYNILQYLHNALIIYEGISMHAGIVVVSNAQ